jgi:hypothetical protein
MNLFGYKQSLTALAEVIEDGRAKVNEETKKKIESSNSGDGGLYFDNTTLQLAVRVLPENEEPFEAQMETGFTSAFLLKPGVQVLVKYNPKNKAEVSLVDDYNTIVGRNPQLIKTPAQANKPVRLCPHCGKYYEGTPSYCPHCEQPVASEESPQ